MTFGIASRVGACIVDELVTTLYSYNEGEWYSFS